MYVFILNQFKALRWKQAQRTMVCKVNIYAINIDRQHYTIMSVIT